MTDLSEIDVSHIVTVDDSEFLQWSELRGILAAVIQLVTPLATVYPEWKTVYDGETGLRKLTDTSLGRNEHSEIVHAWQVGVSAAPVRRGENGEDAEFIGSQQYNLLLEVDIWGLFDLNQLAGCWTIAENESRLVQATFNRNRENLLMNHPLAHLFGGLKPFDINSIDDEPFSDGSNVIIVQCLTQIEVLEQFNN